MTGTAEDGFSSSLEGVQGPAQPAAEPTETPRTHQIVPWKRGDVKSNDYRTCPQVSSKEDGAGCLIGGEPEKGEVRIKRWNDQVALAWFFEDGRHTGIIWSQADFEALLNGEDPMAKEAANA